MYMEPISLHQGKIFAVDIELNILDKSDDLLSWLTVDENEFFTDNLKSENEDIVDVDVKNVTETSEEKTEEKTDDTSESDSNEHAGDEYLWL